MTRTILITGATAGFGAATAKTFARHGWKLVLTGRRQHRLESLCHELGNDRAWPLCADIRDRKAMEDGIKALPHHFQDVSVLVNNAGLALGIDPAQSCHLDDWQTVIDTNINGLLVTTRLLLPRLIAFGPNATIINIGSIAGSYSYPGSNVYGASKAFVRQFSLNLRTDLHGTGVRVSCLEPGIAESEFSNVRFRGDNERADSVYANTTPLTPEDIAETIYWIVSQPSHVNINTLEVMPTAQSPGAPLPIHTEED